MNLAGTFRYRQRPYPAMGEGLALEIARMGPPRNIIRQLAEQKESISGARPMPVEGAEGDAMNAGSGVSPIPVSAGVAKTNTPVKLDEDMMDDVVELAKMQRGERLDVQANAATAAAGLTTNRESCGLIPHHVRTFRRSSRSAVAASPHRARLAEETYHFVPGSL